MNEDKPPELNFPDDLDNHINAFIEKGRDVAMHLGEESVWNVVFTELSSKLSLELPSTVIEDADYETKVRLFAEKNKLSYRKISLQGNWWRQDQGVLLVCDKGGTPKLLMPRLLWGTLQYNPSSKTWHKLTEADRENFPHEAILFYPNLPNHALSLKNIILFCFKFTKIDIYRIFFSHAALGILSLILPFFSGYIFDDVIPNSDRFGLVQISSFFMFVIILQLLINLNYSVAASRFKLKTNVALQAAVWLRILKLPIGFFSMMSAGDISDRAGSIDTMQQTLSITLMSSLLGSLFSILALILMLIIAPGLGAILFGLIFIMVLVNITISLMQMRHYQKIYAIDGKLYGFLFQVLQNIAKIKTLNRQHEVFSKWVGSFLHARLLDVRAEKLSIYLDVFGYFALALGTVIIYLFAGQFENFDTFGDYIIFSSLYAQFMVGALALSSSISTLIRVSALYHRVKPILSCVPEDSESGIKVRQMLGDIEINNMYFRYDNLSQLQDNFSTDLQFNGYVDNVNPWVLHNLSIKIHAGESVGIIGESGCGKSTLIKIMLGLLTPQKGTVSIDDYDLNIMNKQFYRTQLGLVLQSSTMFSGSIKTNLKIRSAHEQELIYAMAEQIGFLPFLESLPMGLDTVISEGGRNISVGQRQRLLILKALLQNPKIILFDESTSALDNESQIKVMDYLAKLDITRIYVAHRLTTLQSVDKIIRINQGQASIVLLP